VADQVAVVVAPATAVEAAAVAAAPAQAAAAVDLAVADRSSRYQSPAPCCCSAAASLARPSTGDGAKTTPKPDLAALLRRAVRPQAWLGICLVLTACAGSGHIEQACLELVNSPPDGWGRAYPRVIESGTEATAPLIDALRAAPTAPGRQAALFALGELGDRSAVGFLIAEAAAGNDHGFEAALALGKLGDDSATEPLRDLMLDPSQDVTARTAAACALLDLGATDEAVPLLSAVLLAGTPYGRDQASQHGLPSKSRWALERQIAIDAIARASGGQTFGLDPDSSWPRLADGVRAWREYLQKR